MTKEDADRIGKSDTDPGFKERAKKAAEKNESKWTWKFIINRHRLSYNNIVDTYNSSTLKDAIIVITDFVQLNF